MEYILSDISEPEHPVIQSMPESTLSELKQFLQEQFNVICSISTVDRFLSGKFYSIKKIYGSVEEKNSERVKNLRMKYVEDFQHNQWRSGQCIYIDEMGFNAWMRRTHGRSKTGTRINAILPNSRGRNMSPYRDIFSKLHKTDRHFWRLMCYFCNSFLYLNIILT